jgi:chitinase
MYKKLFYFIGAIATLFSAPTFAAEEAYKVIGYYPSWAIYRTPSFKPHDIDLSLVTHVNYAFVKMDKEGNLQLVDPWADVEYRSNWNIEKPYWGNFRELTDLKKQHPQLKTLFSVGGWTLSDNFSVVAENPATRKNFVQNAIDFAKKYHFDGIDIDWEYPGFVEHSGRPQDKENYTLLLKELYTAAKAQNPPLLVTIAAPAGPSNIANLEIGKIHQYLDWINLMTYDFHGPWGDSDNQVTNHNAPLYAPAVGNPQLSVAAAVDLYLQQGVPPKKLILGMPIYGRSFSNTEGLFTAYKGAGVGTTQEAGMRFFYDIKENLLPRYQYGWDSNAQVPYLFDPTSKEFVSYDDEASLRLKSKFIKQYGLGGAMVWELGMDTRPNWDAMHAIVDELKAP